MSRYTRRRFLQGSVAGSLALTFGHRLQSAPFARPLGANDDIRIAIIGLGQVGPPGVGGRGLQLIDLFRQVSRVRIVALCDVDEEIMDRELQRFASWQERVKTYRDMRDVFAAPDVDAVVIATPNHWHALATVWGCQAGKDVYVEKPASHSLWEGRQMVAAARKHQRIVQVGTQSRSADVSQQAVDFIQSGQLGKIQYAQAVIYRRRESIGKVDGPQPVPASVDYDLWLGPAQKSVPRREFHYDWHWQWPTGNGEIGNNGVHSLDRCRWLIGQDKLPRRAISLGGRFNFFDDGQTPNTHVALLDYEPAPILCEVRGLTEKPGSKKMDLYRSMPKGIIVQCEGGAYMSAGNKSAVSDSQGRQITEFKDRRATHLQKPAHQQNFIDAMRNRKKDDLNAEVQDGHLSAALCHLANVSYRLGSPASPDSIKAAVGKNAQCVDSVERMCQHLDANGVDLSKTPAVLGAWVTLDPESESFVGEHADQANALSRSAYRKPFVVPEVT
jgi:predicted dehydrogenase